VLSVGFFEGIVEGFDPYSRTNILRYSDTGYLSNIVDVSRLALGYSDESRARAKRCYLTPRWDCFLGRNA